MTCSACGGSYPSKQKRRYMLNKKRKDVTKTTNVVKKTTTSVVKPVAAVVEPKPAVVKKPTTVIKPKRAFLFSSASSDVNGLFKWRNIVKTMTTIIL